MASFIHMMYSRWILLNLDFIYSFLYLVDVLKIHKRAHSNFFKRYLISVVKEHALSLQFCMFDNNTRIWILLYMLNCVGIDLALRMMTHIFVLILYPVLLNWVFDVLQLVDKLKLKIYGGESVFFVLANLPIYPRNFMIPYSSLVDLETLDLLLWGSLLLKCISF
jgi:hypothetical protein